MAADGYLNFDTRVDETGFNKGVKNIGGGLKSLLGILSKVAAAVGVAFGVGAIVSFSKAGIELASDLQEVQNVVDVTFGSMAKDVNTFADSALKAYGLSELAAKRYASTVGAILKSTGITGEVMKQMSLDITKLSADMASFYNLDTDTAFEKIRAGLTGETEPLKAIGVNLSVANLEAFALAQGITTAYSAMSQADQVILRYNYLLSVTADAQGDFARTGNSYANQLRLLTECINSASTACGQELIPILVEIIPYLTIVVQQFARLIGLLFGVSDAAVSVGNGASSPIDTGGMEDATGAVEDYAGALDEATAAQERSMAEFDRLNKLSGSSGGGSSGGAPASGGISLDIAGYDGDTILSDMAAAAAETSEKLAEVENAFSAVVDFIVTNKDQIVALLAGIVAGIIAWEVAQWALNLATAANPITLIVLAAAAAVAALTAGVVLLVEELSKPSIQKPDILQGVSETTAEVLGGFMELSDGVDRELKAMLWSQKTITADMVQDLKGKYAEMTKTLTDALETQKTESHRILTEMYAANSELSAQDKADMLQQVSEAFTRRQETIKALNDEALAILEKYGNDTAALSERDAARLAEINQLMMDNAITTLTASEEEQLLIRQRIADAAGDLSALQAAEIVKNSIAARDGAIAEAEASYNEQVLIAHQLYADGTAESKALADQIIADAKKQKEESIAAAEQMHAKILEEAKAQTGEMHHLIDWSNGEVKSKWDMFVYYSELGHEQAFGGIKRGIADVWNSILEFFSGLGDGWATFWADVGNFFIDIWNGILSGLESAINWIVGGLNKIRIEVPQWVADLLGMHGTYFGFNLPPVSIGRASRIVPPPPPRGSNFITPPAYATGTVVPANYGEFLAILGDNKREPEIVSPVSAMKQAFLEALRDAGFDGSRDGGNISLVIDGKEFGRVVRSTGDKRDHITGGIHVGRRPVSA